MDDASRPSSPAELRESVSEHDDQQREESPWTKQKIFVLLVMMYANFCLATCWSLPAPFFPLEAELKGATPTAYGLVFGAFQLTALVSAPILAKMLPVLTPKFVMISGIFIAGSCSILFGLLQWSPPGVPFIALAFSVRIVEAVGVTAYYTTVYGIIPILFPTKVATVISFMETIFGIGSIMGPTVGGALYQIGGYYLPFVVMGSLLLTGTLVTYVSFPKQLSSQEEPPADIWKMVSNAYYLVDMMVFAMCFLCIGFNEATLEPHIRQFNLQPVVLGLVFVISGGLYAFSAPIWGYLTDKKVDPKLLCIGGCFSCALSFLIIGPAPFFGFTATLPIVMTSQVFLGIGLGAKLICSYMHAMKNLVPRGFPDSVSTYGLFSGLSNLFSAAGAFIGPSMGGALLDFLGYPSATMFVVGMESIVIVIAILFWIRGRMPAPNDTSEEEPLLKSKDSGKQVPA